MHHFNIRQPVIWAAVLTSLLVLAGPGTAAAQAAAPVAAAPVTSRGLPDFTDLVDRVGPSVVNIRTLSRVSRSDRQTDPDIDELFRRFFGVPVPQQPQRPRTPDNGDDSEVQPSGVASGFIISPDGYIMTNAHVVEGADELMVTLTDRREFKAKVIGADKRTDVAVIKIDAGGNLPAVAVGDPNKLRVGAWVVAIGSPFGLDNTVTAGIVSAKQRDTGEYINFIQTDVAINPGNSGGPLINMAGEVVGINSQIYSRSGGFMGISFSIPIDEAMRVANQLRTTGRVVRGMIGVQIDQVTREVSESLGLGSQPYGALVRAVEPDGPAAKAGVEAGDIITQVNGRRVEKASDLPRMIGELKPGSSAQVVLFRRGATRTVNVPVAEFPSESSKAATSPSTPPRTPSVGSTRLGLTVADLTAAQKRTLQVKGGVSVQAADGPAARAGLREGDVVLAIGNVEILTTKQFEETVTKLDPSRAVTLLVRRDEWVQYVLVRPNR